MSDYSRSTQGPVGRQVAPLDARAWQDLSVLVTGGTGSFGQKFVEMVLRECPPRRLIVFSRDELKQHDMRQRFPEGEDSPMRYFIGDVRDKDRLMRAFAGVDVVVHAAALKQVPTAEYNPFEAVLTNIMGAKNVIDAALDRGVGRVIGLSTDKAVNPINLYGATKLVAEKLFVSGNSYVGSGPTRFSVVRYGNVIGSRGSVLPFFLQLRKTGRLPVTDERMTRFWITLEDAVHFVMGCLGRMEGGEVFVPKIHSMRIVDLARAVGPECDIDFVGIRPGEKINEVLISEDEASYTVEFEDMYMVQPRFPWWEQGHIDGGQSLPEGFRYSSDTNPRWLSGEQMAAMIAGVK